MPTAPPADPRRRVRLRARVCYAREDGECSRVRPSDGCARWVRPSAPAALARGPLELDPPAFLAWAPSLLGAWGRPACARYAPTSLSCARTARLAGGTSNGTSVGGFACLCGKRLFALWLCTLSLAVAVCVCRTAVCVNQCQPPACLVVTRVATPHAARSRCPQRVRSRFPPHGSQVIR